MHIMHMHIMHSSKYCTVRDPEKIEVRPDVGGSLCGSQPTTSFPIIAIEPFAVAYTQHNNN